MKTLKLRSSFGVLLIVLAAYSVFTATTYQYARLTADTTLYIDIAEKYVRGEFGDAVNGYWGPFLSWLLIPFLSIGFSHVFAINALDLIIGVLTITGVWVLSYRFEMTERIRSAILIATLPISLFIALIEPFDFLLLCILIYYLTIVFDDEYQNKTYHGALCGILGAFAYFTKSYAFPFFVVHFTSLNVAHYFKSETREHKRNVLKNAAAGIIIFLMISGPWIALISSKYGHFTISNMGKGNFANKAPGLPQTGTEFGGPVFYEGFFAPPNDTAMSAWEDLSYIWEDRKSWSPLDSFENFKYFAKNVAKNVIECMRIFQTYSRLSFTIIIAYILILIAYPFDKERLNGSLYYSFFTLVLYVGGYAPFHFEVRYIWIANILLLVMGGYIVNLLFQSKFFISNTRKNVLLLFFVLSFILTPSKSFVQIGKTSINKEMYMLGTMLKSKYDFSGKIASNREWKHEDTHEAWHKTFRLTYWLGNSTYYGQEKWDINDNDLEKELKEFDIDYYFLWGESNRTPEFLYQYKEVTGGDVTDLKIYSLKEKK